MLARSVDVDGFLACFTLNLLGAALLIAMELHIFSIDSKPASELTWLKNLFACFNMLKSLLIAIDTLTLVVGALELEIHQVLFHSSMHFPPFNSLVSKTLFRAAIIFLSPWGNTGRTKDRLAAAALKWILDDIGTNRTAEVISSILLGFVSLDNVRDVKTSFAILEVLIRFRDIR